MKYELREYYSSSVGGWRLFEVTADYKKWRSIGIASCYHKYGYKEWSPRPRPSMYRTKYYKTIWLTKEEAFLKCL